MSSLFIFLQHYLFFGKMELAIRKGSYFETFKVVDYNDTAASIGSGTLEVYATPAMIALMEHAGMLCIAGCLPEGWGSVGVEVHVRHIKASLIGSRLCCRATVEEVDGRKIVFSVKVWQGEDVIGSGTHTRVIVNNQNFIENLEKKKPHDK